ncbi:MAG: adenine phosphoribosyltransferase [Pseudonocardiales bacterium]|nr:adenine phosphoribosyltransferase [Pseudonocardiales bacterium]
MPEQPDPVGEADDLAAAITARLRDVPDFPQPGVVFKDIAPLLGDAALFGRAVVRLGELARQHQRVDLVAGVEARGFILAGALARELATGVVPVRKAGKLPPPTVRRSYQLEYGSAEIEVPVGLLDGRRVFLVDDVLATGGTLRAAADLLAQAGAEVVGVAVLLEIGFLNGRAALTDIADLHALLTA